jgi:hypothetical protein
MTEQPPPALEQIATITIDSGQLLLIDPCYIDSRWTHREFEDIRPYRNKHTGKVLTYPQDFTNYEQVIPEYGTTMNALNATGEWEPVAQPLPAGLNYHVCSMTTLQAQRGGAVDLGAAVSTGQGDGRYPVYVKRDADGRITQVLIDFQ